MAARSAFDQRLSAAFDRKTATALASLDLHTVGDLLYHFPRRYLEFHQVSDLSRPQVGEHLTVVANVESASSRRSRDGRHHLLKVIVSDASGHRLELTFITRSAGAVHGWAARLRPGTRAMFDGKVSRFNGVLQLTNPRFEPIDSGGDGQSLQGRAGMVLPIYPAGAKAASWMIARAVLTVLPAADDAALPDVLPSALLAEHGWPSAAEALRLKHNPASLRDVERADQRLKFEEAYVLQLALARRRSLSAALAATPRSPGLGGLLAAFDQTLPFKLTTGQQAVGADIAADLAREHPMHRLLQGEVGSGKTVVALRAMLTVVDAGGQTALLAPTEVLAQQHYRSITAMLGSLASAGMLALDGPLPADSDEPGTRVTLLTGSLGARARREALALAASGEAGIVIGTHALLQESVEFHDLGLVVVDEQHRFGVEQRDALRAKAVRTPHLLVMTATPIPRTVAMTIFGDLETSTLREIPAGRSPIASHVVPATKPAWVKRTWEVVRAQVDAGRQAFVVCPAIDPPAEAGKAGSAQLAEQAELDAEGGWSEVLPGLDDLDQPGDGGSRANVTEVMAALAVEPALAGLRLGVLHGRLPSEEKEAVMAAFAAGRLDVLVATTVIEVGVDVPNASVMVIMDANRFGISQLHQLRGRVGRGGHPGFCFFVTSADATAAMGSVLEQVARTADGFTLARLDLEHRREGDVLGAAQSGALSSLRVLRVTHDEDVIVAARALATDVVAADPDLAGHPELRAAIDTMLNPEREVFLERG